MTTARNIVDMLDLEPHPEGGWYRQTFIDENPEGGRALSTAIYYLLSDTSGSAWHRVDAAEVWHFYAGGPIEIDLSEDGKTAQKVMLGPNIAEGQRPQVVVPRGVWQSARSHGAWSLVGCTVAPGFRFEGFEMAPEGWQPG